VESTAEMVRLVGLSATLPNYEDVATLLRVKRDHGLFKFSAAYRPCPLAQTFIGVTVKKPLQRFQLMNDICYNKIMDAAGKHQVMIFVHSRKETAKTARFLRDKALEDGQLNRIMRPDSGSRELLQVLHPAALCCAESACVCAHAWSACTSAAVSACAHTCRPAFPVQSNRQGLCVQEQEAWRACSRLCVCGVSWRCLRLWWAATRTRGDHCSDERLRHCRAQRMVEVVLSG
jgi:hypothetical protein